MSKINIKGRCKIELTDVKTGKVEAIEHDNMVTKALEYFYAKGGITNRSAFNASYVNSNALYTLLGGIMCLDTELDEDDEIVRVPEGVKMTANGARDQLNSGNPTELGSYNDSESGWQQDGSLKMVWDWTTSQGNGTIASIGLSSCYGGMCGIGNALSKERKANAWSIDSYNSVAGLSGISGIPIAYKNNRVYALETFVNVTKWTINVYDFPYSQIDMRDTMTARLVDTIEVNIPAAIQNLPYNHSQSTYLGYGEEYRIHQSGDDIYIILCCSDTGYTASYDRMVFSDSYPAYAIKYTIGGSVTATPLTPTNTGIPAVTGSNLYFTYGISSKWAIVDDYLVDLGNLANVSEFDGAIHNFNWDTTRIITAITEDTFYRGSNYYDASLVKSLPRNNNGNVGGIGQMPDNPLMIFTGGALYRDPQYLATIFNLESPVTKTADKTMKVTYVLRFS